MLFISSDKSNRNSFFLNLLSKNLRLEEFKDLQIVSLNCNMQRSLKLEALPLYIDNDGKSLMSLQQISRTLTDMVKLTPLLIGFGKNESSDVFKWFELDTDFR